VCAGQLVDAALGAGVKVAVCSSNSQRNVKLIVESMGVRHGCAAWVCGVARFLFRRLLQFSPLLVRCRPSLVLATSEHTGGGGGRREAGGGRREG